VPFGTPSMELFGVLVKEIAKRCYLTGRPFGVILTTLPSIRKIPYDEYRCAIAYSGIDDRRIG
jgi:hypothetical protein